MHNFAQCRAEYMPFTVSFVYGWALTRFCVPFVHCLASKRSCAARLLWAHLDPCSCLWDCCLHSGARPACMCVKESALNITTKQQAADTPIFTSMYVLHAYTTLGLYMCTASIVSTDSKLASSRSQSCLWLDKTSFFHYTPVDLCTLNSAIISRHCMVLLN